MNATKRYHLKQFGLLLFEFAAVVVATIQLVALLHTKKVWPYLPALIASMLILTVAAYYALGIKNQ